MAAEPFLRARHILCLGAHPDDIEIGAAGTLLRIADENADATFRFLVLTATGERAEEARRSAGDLLPGRVSIEVGGFRDGYLPYQDARAAKEWVAANAGEADLVLTHTLDDRHQDHEFVARLAWQLFRGATILEYEIPKWEGDRPDANLYVPLDDRLAAAKVAHLESHFASQHGKPWYRREVFEAVMALRGVECARRWAEGFVARKLKWG
ncbi:MAG: PIG-L family deacetylase [Actinomycetes bacterium]|jgi:LmbE family N-acetylglucosaminyl deacetylase|nr:MAG: hypothetical protein DIU67_07720 [Actinomycetota bacterium]